MSQSEEHGNRFSKESFLPATRAAFDMRVDFFDALSNGDIAKAANTFAIDGILLFPGLRPVRGRPLIKRMLGIIRRRYERIVWLPAGPVIASDNWQVTSWSVSGTFSENAHPYENEVLSLVRLDADGRIAMLSDYFKDTGAFHSPRLIPQVAGMASLIV